MPDYKNEPAGIEKLLPWGDFIKERCSGLMLKIKHLNTMNQCLFKAKDTKGAVGNTVDYSSLTIRMRSATITAINLIWSMIPLSKLHMGKIHSPKLLQKSAVARKRAKY